MNADEVNDWMVAICPASGGEPKFCLPAVAVVFTSNQHEAYVSINTSRIKAEVSSFALIQDQSGYRFPLDNMNI